MAMKINSIKRFTLEPGQERVIDFNGKTFEVDIWSLGEADIYVKPDGTANSSNNETLRLPQTGYNFRLNRTFNTLSFYLPEEAAENQEVQVVKRQ